MHGLGSYLDMSNKDMKKRRNVDIKKQEVNSATLKATQNLISKKTNKDERGVKKSESKEKCVLC